jgi:hypothetical protein
LISWWAAGSLPGAMLMSRAQLVLQVFPCGALRTAKTVCAVPP